MVPCSGQRQVHNVLLNTPLVGTVLKEGQKTVRITEAGEVPLGAAVQWSDCHLITSV